MASQGRSNKSPAHTPRTSSPKLPRHSSLRSKEITAASLDINSNVSTEDNLQMVNTAKLSQRKLALSACGFEFDTKGFERELIE
jgi:hypothetical protein